MLDTLAERERLTSLALAGGWTALILALLACFWIASELFWRLVPGEPESVGPAALGPRADTSGTRAQAVALEDLHLFGQAGSMALPQVIEAPETSLDLLLLGTLATPDPTEGLAIIADGEGNESYYGVGDDLPGSARLHEIHADRVLLVRSGRYETLSLREDDPARSNRPRRGGAVARSPAPAAPAVGPNIAGIRGVDWQAVQQQYRVDAAKVAEQVRFQPYTQNGKPVGVRLQAGRDAELMRLMARAGLHPSDVITSVNGIPLNDPSRTFEAISQLQNETRFDVEVLRQGRRQSLTIDLNQ